MKACRGILIAVFLLGMMGKNGFAQTIDPADNNANYQKALSLYQAGASADGIPYLENILKTNSTIKPAAYDLLGNIYDKIQQPDKAIAAYNEGIKLDPNYQNLRFNLGLAYFRIKKYADAEQSAIDAIKLDTKHANSQRLYGLVAFHQNKRVAALLAFCSFLLLDPSNVKASEARTNIQSILNGGELKAGQGIATNDKSSIALNTRLTGIIAAGKTKKLTGKALLEYQLKSIFIMAGEQTAKKPDKDFFDKYFAEYFYKLAQGNNMTAFAKWISQGSDINDSRLTDWVNSTERGF